MRSSTTEELERYVAFHAPIRQATSFAAGERVGEWRITAFLGSGGSGEVYRAERVGGAGATSGADGANAAEIAALKVLVKEGDAARARFQREVDLLSKNRHAAFPRFYGSGVAGRSPRDRRDGKDDTLYYAMELLQPVELPSAEADVADYILAVSRAVAILHRHGFVHRDIKPQNVMRRSNGDLVLIDMGLVKELSRPSPSSGISVTVVDGKVVGAGTPRYAAPEQFSGGAISPATDIHALGMLANECFGGHPPRVWERIVSRSTSSIPERRYADVDAFARAIRRRHCARMAIWCGLAAAIAIAAAIACGTAASTKSPRPPQAASATRANPGGDVADIPLDWRSLACDLETNVVERRIVREKLVTNDFGRVMQAEVAWSNATKAVHGTVIRLGNRRHSFSAPMMLETNRVYWIAGPGTLDVPLDGKPGARVILDNCVLINRTTNSVASCGVRYVFGRGSYLNFINLDRDGQAGCNAYMEDFDGEFNALEFEGPETLKELLRRRAAERRRQLELEMH